MSNKINHNNMLNNKNINEFIFGTETVISKDKVHTVIDIETENTNNSDETNNSSYFSDDKISYEKQTFNESLLSSDIQNINDNDNKEDLFNTEMNTEYNTEYHDKIYNRYIINDKVGCIKFNDEVKDLIKKTNSFSIHIIKNDLENVKKNISSGHHLFMGGESNIVKLCSNKNCHKLSCSKDCYKNDLYKSFWNFNRGIKTIYNLLFKLLLSHPVFRVQCKCCENYEYSTYLFNLDKNFLSSQNITSLFESVQNNFEPIKNLELNINFLINKFTGVIGILDCECKYKNKLHSFYTTEYLNYSNIIKIYIKTIPLVIKLLKTYFEIKDNHEELILSEKSRCIHEDIRYNNLTFCSKKKYNQVNKNYLSELIMRLDLTNNWVFDSIKITNILLNQQSLEYFMYYSENKPCKLIEIFNKIYSPNNNFLDLNYTSNKNNIINAINLNYDKLKSINIDKLFMLIYKQLCNRNKIISNYNINAIIINYIYESINYKNISLAFKWLEYVKNIRKKTDVGTQSCYEIEKIFNMLLDNDILSISEKISYLKIINKNKTNIIEYDFVNKLIDLKIGDVVILEFNKEENTLFNIGDYKNKSYIDEIIKKCICNNKVNILDYILFNLNKSIREYNIDPISLYLINISNKNNKNNTFNELIYIDLLKTIIKYHNETNTKLLIGLENKKYTPIEFCIENNLHLSALILIRNLIDINISNTKDFELLIKCVEKSNTVIFEYILEANPKVITNIVDGLNIITYLFVYYEKQVIRNSNVLFIFLFKIFKHMYNTKNGVELLNYQDELNELVGFKLLNIDNLSSEEKTTLFKLIIEYINPLELNNMFIQKNKITNTLNYPLIVHSMLVEELEITFLLLNCLLKNGMIKKNTTNNGMCKIYDYYLTKNIININFIPIIFKYIKDNQIQCNKFKENIHDGENNFITTLGINNASIVIIICVKFIVFFVLNKIDNYEQKELNKNTLFKLSKFSNIDYETNNKINNKINNKLVKNTNKYVEITIGSDDNFNQLNTITNDEYNNNNIKNFQNNNLINKYKSKILEKTNKNIWISSSISHDQKYSKNQKNPNMINQFTNTVNLTESLETSEPNVLKNNINNLYKFDMLDSESSNVSESDVLFEYK